MCKTRARKDSINGLLPRYFSTLHRPSNFQLFAAGIFSLFLLAFKGLAWGMDALKICYIQYVFTLDPLELKLHSKLWSDHSFSDCPGSAE